MSGLGLGLGLVKCSIVKVMQSEVESSRVMVTFSKVTVRSGAVKCCIGTVK